MNKDIPLDNPAIRLHRVLVGLQTYGDQSKSLRNPLSRILGTENSGDLLHRTGLVLGLPASAWHVAEASGAPVDQVTKCLASIEDTLGHLALHPTVSSFVTRIDVNALAQLHSLGVILHLSAAEPTIEQTELDLLRHDVQALLDDVREATDVSSELRIFMFRHLYKLREALDVYSITGLLPIDDATKIATIDAVAMPAAVAATESKFWRFVAKVALLVGLANQTLALGNDIASTAPDALGAIGTVVEEIRALSGPPAASVDDDVVDAEIVEN